jgi:uncharacterized membrane protein (DUF4010 family)
MLATFLKTSGADQLMMHSVIVLGFAVAIFVFAMGWLAHTVASEISFGIFGNAAILLAGMLAGLVAFNGSIEPLKMVSALTVAGVAIGSAISALLAISVLRALPH